METTAGNLYEGHLLMKKEQSGIVEYKHGYGRLTMLEDLYTTRSGYNYEALQIMDYGGPVAHEQNRTKGSAAS